MPLWWSIQKVQNYEELMDTSEDREVWPDSGEHKETLDELMTRVLVFATMSVGMDSITAKNVDEFILRVRMVEDTGMRFWYDGKGERQRIPASAIRRRIGLETNASTYTRAQFDKHIVTMMRERAQREIRSEDRDEQKEAA